MLVLDILSQLVEQHLVLVQDMGLTEHKVHQVQHLVSPQLVVAVDADTIIIHLAAPAAAAVADLDMVAQADIVQ
jgi:hypothetical protein